jgi:tetratricopeptide (TPR) repeat protein
LRLDPRNAEALGGLSRAYESAGRTKDAEQSLKMAIALRPDYWDVYNNLALFYDRQNRFDEAIAQLQKAIALTPDNAQLYLNLGAVYADTSEAKNLSLAEAALKKSIELSPSYAAYANIGFVYSQLGRYGDAAAATEKALQLNGGNYEVWRNLGDYYLWLHDPSKAARARQRELELVVKQAEIHPQDAELLSELATLYADQHSPEKSRTYIQKALALAGENSTVLMNAAEVSEVLGSRTEAIRYAEQGLRKGFSLDDLKKRYALQALLADPNFKAPAGK